MDEERLQDLGGLEMEFLLCILQYELIMAILVALGIAGAFIGIRIRKSKDAKKEKESINS